ncbi:MAG: hypothetical protein R6V10_08330 [bacterium]
MKIKEFILRRRTCLALSVVAAFLLAAAALPGLASEAGLGLSDLSAQADAVARVRISSINTGYRHTPHGKLPFILYEAETLELMAGTAPATFIVPAPAAAGKSGIHPLPGGPALQKGKEYVLFLNRVEGDKKELFYLVSPGQGALPVVSLQARGKVVPLPWSKRNPQRGFVHIRLKDLESCVKAVRDNLRREEQK